MNQTALPITVQLICICAAACKQDSIEQGLVDPQAAAAATGEAEAGGAAAPGAGGMTDTLTSGVTGTGPGGTTATVTSGMAGAATSGTSSMGTTGGASTGTGGGSSTSTHSMSSMRSGDAGMPTPIGSTCDVSGRWIATVHLVTETLGQEQTTHLYTYYEIGRQADAYEVTKGLYCGDDAASTGDLAVMVDLTAAWPAERMKVSNTGRTVTSTQSGNGCAIHFGKTYTVRGATLPYYLDPTNALPAADQKASGSTPGWEDWDNDGQPGVTGLLSGPGATGRIFVAPRQWTELSGTVPNTMTSFRLPVDWDQEQNVMAYDPSWNITLGTPSSRHPDNSLHFAEFVRLTDGQATGDDNAICDAVIKLAPMLTPEASAI